MEVTKIKNDKFDLHNFYLQEGDKVLNIVFGGNLDLYWTLANLKHNDSIEKIQNETYHETFTITKDNYFIYDLFEELMEDVKEARIYKPEVRKTTDGEEESCHYISDPLGLSDIHESEEEECERLNGHHRNNWQHKLLYDGKSINWHSDEEEYNVANSVKITKVDDTYVLDFSRPPIRDGKYPFFASLGRIPIRFRNSGSTYDPFNIIFMRMYNKLQEYNPEYHQIHIEEITYHKKRVRKKENKQ